MFIANVQQTSFHEKLAQRLKFNSKAVERKSSCNNYQFQANLIINNKSARDLLELKKKIQQKDDTPREREKSLVSLRKIHDFLENSLVKDDIDIRLLKSTFKSEYFNNRNLFTFEPNIWTPRSMND